MFFRRERLLDDISAYTLCFAEQSPFIDAPANAHEGQGEEQTTDEYKQGTPLHADALR